MFAAIGAPIAAWLAGTYSGSGRCQCFVEVAQLPEPSSGVLELLREQLQRCGPERLQTTCLPCPIPTPCAPPSFDGVAFCGGILVGAFLITCLLLVSWLGRKRPPVLAAIGDQQEAYSSPVWRKPPNAQRA